MAMLSSLARPAGSGTNGSRGLRMTQRKPRALETFGKSEIERNHVVDVYLADIEVGDNGAPTLLHYREKMRAVGPSVRRDLGKQAGKQPSDKAASEAT